MALVSAGSILETGLLGQLESMAERPMADIVQKGGDQGRPRAMLAPLFQRNTGFRNSHQPPRDMKDAD